MAEDEVESLVDVYDCPRPVVNSGARTPSYMVMKVWYTLLHISGEFMSGEVKNLADEIGVDVSARNVGYVMRTLSQVGYFTRVRNYRCSGRWMYKPTIRFILIQGEFMDV